MADSRRARPGQQTVDVASIAEFVKGFQQRGLKSAAVIATPFAVNALIRMGSRK